MFGLLQVINKRGGIMLCKVVYFFGFLRLLPKNCNFCRPESVFLPFFCLLGACNLLNTNKEKFFCAKIILYQKKCIFAPSNKRKK